MPSPQLSPFSPLRSSGFYPEAHAVVVGALHGVQRVRHVLHQVRLGLLPALGLRPQLAGHLEVQVDILAREPYLEFSNLIFTHMKDTWTLTPGFYTEFRAGSM